MKTKIIIPVKTEEDRKTLQYVLAEVIHLLSNDERSETQESIYWLSTILLFSFTLDE